VSWPGFYNLTGAWFFLLLIPLIIFYFLKLKRPQLDIPSLALWRQVINDQRVNSPFQKFKRNILLYLQLLLLTLLVLAVMQPFMQSGAERAEYLPVLIDTSASMAALDASGDKSRLDVAKDQVRSLIEDLLPDQRLSLISMDSTAQRITDFTDNKRLLLKALDNLEVHDVPSKMEDGLRMTQALARTVPIDTVLVFSDGNFPEQVDFELPFELNYQQVGPAGKNIGITAFNARRSKSSRWDVFVRVAAGGTAASTGSVELYRNGEMIGEDTFSLETGESERLIFRIESEEAAKLEARLIPGGNDSLKSDNMAFLDLPTARPLTIHAHTGMAAFRHAIRSTGESVLYPDDDGDGDAASYDLIFSDEAAAQQTEAMVAVFVGVIPDDLSKMVTTQVGLSEIVDWERTDPLLQHTELSASEIADEIVLAEDVNDASFEELGYEIVAHTRTGPLILKKNTGEKIAYYLLFHTNRSTLPYHISFPVIIANAADIAMRAASLSEVRGAPTKVIPDQQLSIERTYSVEYPDGQSRE